MQKKLKDGNKKSGFDSLAINASFFTKPVTAERLVINACHLKYDARLQ